MGEQNRRAVDLEPADPPATVRRRGPPKSPGEPQRALTPEADERQTLREAPDTASPGESASDDGIG